MNAPITRDRADRNLNHTDNNDDGPSLPLAARVLMRRFHLMPGLATAIAAAAGFNLEVK